MNFRNKLGILLISGLISVSCWAAAVWVGSQYIETFQNGFLFGNFNILKVSNGVPEFEDASGNVKRLDDQNKDRFFVEDFEGAAVSYTCGANLTAADVSSSINGDAKTFTQGATPPTVGVECVSPTITLAPKQIDAFIGVTFYAKNDGNTGDSDFVVYDEDDAELVRIPIKAETGAQGLKHEGFFSTLSTSTSIRYEIEVQTQNANAVVTLDDIGFTVNPLASTEIFASEDWNISNALVPSTGSFGTSAINRYAYKRDGKDAVFNIAGYFSSAGTAGSGVYEFDLPDGLIADTSIVNTSTTQTSSQPSTPIGWLSLSSGAGGVAFKGTVYLKDNNTWWVLFDSAITDAGAGLSQTNDSWNSTTLALDNSNITVKGELRVPIAGWTNTKQGVTVKGQISTDVSSANVFSATVSSTGVVSDENVDWINGDCTHTASSGVYVCAYNSLGLSQLLSCSVKVYNNTVSTSNSNILSTSSSTQLAYQTYNTATASVLDQPVMIICAKQGSDYVKESDRIFTVPVDSLTSNDCTLSGNDAFAVTASTEPLDFNGACTGWISGSDGETVSPATGNYYTVQKNNSKINISLGVASNPAISTGDISVNAYVNGTLYKTMQAFFYDADAWSIGMAQIMFNRGELNAGDTISFAVSQTITMNNNATRHYLNINEEYGDRGMFLGNLPTDFVREKFLSSNITTTQDISDLQFDGLEVGKWYEVTGMFSANSASGNTTFLDFRSAASGGGVRYNRNYVSTNSSNVTVIGVGLSFKFKAVSTSLYVRGTVSGGTNIFGTGGYADTYVQLTELNATK